MSCPRQQAIDATSIKPVAYTSLPHGVQSPQHCAEPGKRGLTTEAHRHGGKREDLNLKERILKKLSSNSIQFQFKLCCNFVSRSLGIEYDSQRTRSIESLGDRVFALQKTKSFTMGNRSPSAAPKPRDSIFWYGEIPYFKNTKLHKVDRWTSHVPSPRYSGERVRVRGLLRP